MIEVLRAPAYATVQDAGRERFRSSGVPRGGAMDMLSLVSGNAVVGNDPRAAAIEWALTGGSLRFEQDTIFALTGAAVEARIGDAPAPHGRALRAASGDVLRIDAITGGRFLYVCFRGGIRVPEVLGGRGTYLPGSFGGLGGRRLLTGDSFALGGEPDTPAVEGALPIELSSLAASGPIGIMQGPQAEMLSLEEWSALAELELNVSPQSDRTGYRLTGLERTRATAAIGRSEPSCTGAVQLTPGGELIVLMADGPTVGGYPKIGVVAAGHLPRLAQTPVGGKVKFRLIEAVEAVTLLATQRSALERLGGEARASPNSSKNP